MSNVRQLVLLGPSLSLLLANAVLVVHVGIAAFVVAGLLLVIVGNLEHWGWVNNAWFRVAHVAAIGIVVAESWLGFVCPLTTLEMWLRSRAGEASVWRRLHRALASAVALLQRASLGVRCGVHRVRLARARYLVVLSATLQESRS